MKTVLRSGILGAGMIGRVHAQAVLANGGTVAAVAGSTRDSSVAAAELYPEAVAVASVNQMIDLGVDVVHVCTPNSLHREQVEAAISSGIPVICEKPLATSSADAASLVALAESCAVMTAVPFIYRYYPMVLEMRERIRRSNSNPLWLLHGSYLQDWLADRSSSNWRVDPELGGASRAFGDIGVHWCDLMEFATGQRITRLSARLGNAFARDGGPHQNATEDGGVISFETDAGAIGSLVISQASAGRRNRLWLSFDGPIEAYSFDQEAPETLWVGAAGANSVVSRDPSREAGVASRATALPSGHPQGYQSCFNDFVGDVHDVLRGAQRSTVLPSFSDGLRAAIITDAVVNASSSGDWVSVDQPS